jgi:hypothetical protein
VPLQSLGPTAGTLSEPVHDVLDARLTVDLGAALRLDCVSGQLETDWTCEALLYIHENYKMHSCDIKEGNMKGGFVMIKCDRAMMDG